MISVTSAEFESLEDPPFEEWAFKVTLHGTGFEARALKLLGTVGDLPLQALHVHNDFQGATGFLEREPDDGAAVRLGYDFSRLTETGIVYERLNV